VESSNVDIATEFAKLIVAQQAYSANAKTVTAFNQVSQATIAMLQ
jgi:flagellar hook protein FlgE